MHCVRKFAFSKIIKVFLPIKIHLVHIRVSSINSDKQLVAEL